MLYGASLQGLRLGRPIIYRDTFGTALFQCLYQPGSARWSMLPATLEWHLAATPIALGGVFWFAAPIAAAMLLLSLGIAVLQARQVVLASRNESFRSRMLIKGEPRTCLTAVWGDLMMSRFNQLHRRLQRLLPLEPAAERRGAS